MDNPVMQRALVLIEQGSFEKAERELNVLLSQNASNKEALVLLGFCKYQSNKLKEALSIINQAISQDPINDFSHYVLSGIYLGLNKKDSALLSIKEAIRLNPYNANYFGLRGRIHLQQKDFSQAKKYAEEGLHIEAENISCLNVRSTALTKLGETEEAYNTIDKALEQDPNNAFTHANHGFILLEKGRHDKALEHFKEALKIDPTNEYAKAGLREALKAKSIVYRWFLKYAFWMSNMKGKKQWAVLIGFYILFNFLKRLAINNEGVQPILIPVLVLMFVFAFSSWFISPLHNLFLFLNRYGKFALSDEEKRIARIVGSLLLSALIFGFSYLIFGKEVLLGLTGLSLLMLIPVGSMFDGSSKTNNRILIGYAICAGLLGLIAISLTYTSGILFNMFTVIFLGAIFIYQWVANALIIRSES